MELIGTGGFPKLVTVDQAKYKQSLHGLITVMLLTLFLCSWDAVYLPAGKLRELDQLLFKLSSSSRKAVILTPMTSMLDLLETHLDSRNVRHLRLDHLVRVTAFDTYFTPIVAISFPGKLYAILAVRFIYAPVR